MGILALAADKRVAALRCTDDTLSVDLMDGRTITVPLVWYPRLANASKAQREVEAMESTGQTLTKI